MHRPVDFSGQLRVLLDKARAGSESAREYLLRLCWEFLRDEAQPRLLGPARRRFDASDLRQQTCLKVLQHLEQFRGGTAQEFRAWLRAIQNHLLHDWLEQLPSHEAPLQPPQASSTFQVPIADPRRTPASSAAARENGAAVQAALERLPEDYRTLLQLRFTDGLSFAEVAERLALASADAAKQKCYRALAALKAQLGGTHATA